MIAATVRMHGFDSPSWARLCAIASHRDRGRERELHVLHDSGRVLAAVDTAEGPVRRDWANVVGPADTARRLREEYGVDRVVVADALAVRAMLAGIEEQVTPAWSQPDVLVAMQQGFRDCAGVVCDPPMPRLDAWRELAAQLSKAGDGAFVLAASTVDGWPIALTGLLAGGLVVEVTDLPADAVAFLPDLDAVAVALGAVIVAAVVVPLADLEAALTSRDVAAALLGHLVTPSSALRGSA
jgi:hypothetical protein